MKVLNYSVEIKHYLRYENKVQGIKVSYFQLLKRERIKVIFLNVKLNEPTIILY